MPYLRLNLLILSTILSVLCGLVPGRNSAALWLASAQDATPDPLACDVAPRPITFIADLVETSTSEVTPTPVTGIPDGSEVTDPATRTDVVTVVEVLIVCVNQGELLRSFALFDDAYLRRLIDPDGIIAADVAIELAKSLATPQALSTDDETVLEEVLLVRELPDGSIAVVFRTRGGVDREADETQVDLLVLRKTAERWLIVDGLTDFDPEMLPPPST